VGYDGRGFHGWARQPGVRSVEGEIAYGILRRGIARSVESARLRVASRTDRGVSARGNAIALTSDLRGLSLLRALNGIAPDIFFTAAREIDPTFSPRRAVARWYRYLERTSEPLPRALELWKRVAHAFHGRIDVRSFGRRLPPSEPVWRDIDSFRVAARSGCLVLDLRAPSFVWGMVRKIVSAGRDVVQEKLSLERLRAALGGSAPLALPLAEPEPLLLWAVEYDRPWTVCESRPTRDQIHRWRGELASARGRADLLELAWGDHFVAAARRIVPGRQGIVRPTEP
jgi:tRNA pseudouridine38-40 synthase